MIPVLALLQKGSDAAALQHVGSRTIVAVALLYFAGVVAISVWAARRTRRRATSSSPVTGSG